MRKVARFGVPVAIGKVATAASGLVTLAILARYLGPEQFGTVALIRTVVTVVDLFANFNTWQTVIKYGTEAIAQQRADDVRRIIKLAFVIDATTAVLGASVVVGLAFVIPGSFGWSPHESVLCAVYALTLVSKVSGTSDGIFRICDAYRVQAIATSAMAIVMTLLVVLVVGLGASFDTCVLALVVGEISNNLVVTAISFWVARQAGYGGWSSSVLQGIRTVFPNIARFLLSTNAQLTVRTVQSELDMLVVGSMLGKASAGLFRVIKQLGTIPGRVFMPFELVLFTELARAAANRDYIGFRRVLQRSVLIAGAGSLLIWAVAAAAARPLVELVAGSDYVAAAGPFRWFLLGMCLQVMGTPIMRAAIALGRPGTLFLFDSTSLVFFVGASITATYLWGLTGIAIVIAGQKLVQITWASTFVFRLAGQRAREAEAQVPSSTTNT